MTKSEKEYWKVYPQEEVNQFVEFATYYFDVADDEELNWGNDCVRYMFIGFMVAKGYR